MDRERHRPIDRGWLGQGGPDGHAAVDEGHEQTPGKLIPVRPRPVADRGPSAGHRSAQAAPYARVTLSSAADDVVDVGGRHPCVERQGQEPLVGAVGDRERQTRVPVAIERVLMDRDVVDVDPDPLGPERLVDAAAVDPEPIEAELDEEEMPGRVRGRLDGREVEVSDGPPASPGSGPRAPVVGRGTHPAGSAGSCRARPRYRSAGSCSRARPSRRSSRVRAASSVAMPWFRKRRRRAARSSSSVRTAPPSPVVRIFAGWRLRTVMSASVPTARPSRVAPSECEASAMIVRRPPGAPSAIARRAS